MRVDARCCCTQPRAILGSDDLQAKRAQLIIDMDHPVFGSFSKSGTYLAIISILPMAFAISRLTDVSIIVWVTNDFGGGDFPKKTFLIDYLRWKDEKEYLGPVMTVLFSVLMLTKLDMIAGLVMRLVQIVQHKKRFHTRHALDLLDFAGFLGAVLARMELKVACKSSLEACEVLDGMRWNARAYHQTEVCENEALNLRRLYVWLMGLNIVMLVCPIIRHFQWEKHIKKKSA